MRFTNFLDALDQTLSAEDPAAAVAAEVAEVLERGDHAPIIIENPVVAPTDDIVEARAVDFLSQGEVAELKVALGEEPEGPPEGWAGEDPGGPSDEAPMGVDVAPVDVAEDGDDENPLVAFTTAVAEEPAPPSDPLVATPTSDFEMPPGSYMHKGQRHTLVFQGVAVRCAHCSMKLTDSVSIERGLGPTCSKRGYLEDPTNPDEIQAMIDLAEYPELVDYLTRAYKPKGVRGLMNGLVKICCLNRKSPVHLACTDAIQSLGYKRLASLLRESVAVVEISVDDAHPGKFKVWVKKSEWNWRWTQSLNAIPGAHYDKSIKGRLVPQSEKRTLWNLMIEYYAGFCATVPDKGMVDGKRTIRIESKKTP